MPPRARDRSEAKDNAGRQARVILRLADELCARIRVEETGLDIVAFETQRDRADDAVIDAPTERHSEGQGRPGKRPDTLTITIQVCNSKQTFDEGAQLARGERYAGAEEEVVLAGTDPFGERTAYARAVKFYRLSAEGLAEVGYDA